MNVQIASYRIEIRARYHRARGNVSWPLPRPAIAPDVAACLAACVASCAILGAVLTLIARGGL